MKRRSILKTISSLAIMSAMMSPAFAQSDGIRERNFKFGTTASEQTSLGQAVIRFAEMVSEKSDGKMTVTVYPNNQLGNEAQQIGATQAGLQDFALLSSTPLSAVVPDLQILDFPGIVMDREEVFKILDGPIGQGLLEQFESRRLVGFPFMENGFRHVTNNVRPIKTLEDMQGLKIRVQQSPSTIDVFAALGANPVAMSWAELYTALETNMVDAQENPFQSIDSGRLYEVQKYMTLTGHVYGAMIPIASKGLMDSLSDAEREIIEQAFEDTAQWQRELNAQLEEGLRAKMEESGMVIEDFPESERMKIAELSLPVIERYSGGFTDDLVGRIRAELGR